MKALLRYGVKPKEWVVKDVLEPSPKYGEIKIQVKYAGICGSDLHMYLGLFDVPGNVVSGHEFSGIISEIGDGVTGFKVGDRVTAEHTFAVCEKCESCRKGNYQLCKKRVSIGFDVDGGFAEYVIVNAKYIHMLPDNISLAEGAMTEPLACALHAVELIAPEVAQKVLIVGPGPIGILTGLCFKTYNCLVDIVGTPADKLRLDKAVEVGINVVDNPEENSYDIIADCSGNEKGIDIGLKAIKAGGKYLQVGIAGKPVTINFDTLLYKEISIQGTFCHHYPTWEKALKMEKMGLVDVKPIISEEISLDQWEDAFNRLLKQEAIKIVIKF